MIAILDIQVDDLLREAEQRLQQTSSTTVAVDKVKRSEDQDAVVAAQPQTQVKAKELSVRHVSRLNGPKTIKDTTGDNWFNLPKTDLTSEFKRDWNILRMRSILDPKHQRKSLRAEPPKYSHVGEIIAGPTEYFSARLTKKERKRTLLDEAVSERDDVKLTAKYAGIQKQKSSGKKAFYQKVVKDRRRGGK